MNRAQRIGAIGALLMVASCEATTASPQVASSRHALTAYFPHVATPTTPPKFYDFRGASLQQLETARAVQGLANRLGANIYIVGSSAEADWKPRLFVADPLVPFAATSLGSLIQYANTFGAGTGALVCYSSVGDGGPRWSLNLALMKAWQTNGIIATSTTASSLGLSCGSGTVVDVRSTNLQIAPHGLDREAYQWAINEGLLAASSGAGAIFVLSSLDANGQPQPLELYDYVTTTRAFVFFLKDDEGPDTAVISQILSSAPPGTPLLGYTNDDSFSKMAARRRLYGHGADWFGNASFWSAFGYQPTVSQRDGFWVVPRTGRRYVSFFTSDGDNLQHNQNWSPDWLINDAQDLNVGLSINPGLAELAPPMHQFLRNAVTTQELIGGPNGLGYSYPELTVQPYLDTFSAWLVDNRVAMDAASLRTAQLWRVDAPQPVASSSTTQWYLFSQPALFGVQLGDSSSHTTNIYGNQVASDAFGVAVPPSDFATRLNTHPGGAHPQFFSFEPMQQRMPNAPSAATDLKSALNAYNTSHPTDLVVALAPRDWFASIREDYFRADTFNPDGGASIDTDAIAVLHSFNVASGGVGLPEEAIYLRPTSPPSAFVDVDHRYADMTGSWEYEFTTPSASRSLVLRAQMAGQFKITVTNPDSLASTVFFGSLGTQQVSQSFTLNDTPDAQGRRLLPAAKLRVKFEDGTPQDGGGPSVWRFEVKLPPAVLELGINAKDSFNGCVGSYCAVGFQSGMSCGAGVDQDHTYVDQSAWMTYALNVHPLRRTTLEFDVTGQFVVEVSASSPGTSGCSGPGAGSWITVAHAHFAQRETVRVDISNVARASSGLVYVRFRDARVTDGNGASVWTLKTWSDDVRSVTHFGAAAFGTPSAPHLPGTSEPEERALLLPTTLNNGSSTNGTLSAGCIVGDGHRYADMSGLITYRLTFPGKKGYVVAELGGDYIVDAAAESVGPPNLTLQAFQSPLETSGAWTNRHRVMFDLTPVLAQSPTQTVYFRLRDRTTSNGGGPSIAYLRAFAP